MRERIIERRAKERFKKLGWVYLKFTPMGESGWPDRIIITPFNIVFWIEFKGPGKDLEPLQKIRQRDLRRMGYICEKVTNIVELNLVINEVLKRL